MDTLEERGRRVLQAREVIDGQLLAFDKGGGLHHLDNVVNAIEFIDKLLRTPNRTRYHADLSVPVAVPVRADNPERTDAPDAALP